MWEACGAHGDPRALRPRATGDEAGTVEPPAPRPRQIMVRAWWRAGDGTGLCCVFEDFQSYKNAIFFRSATCKALRLNRRAANSEQPAAAVRRPKGPKREGGRSPPL